MNYNISYSEPDPTLLHDAKGGNHRAFTEIVRKYENLVYSFAFKVCRDKDKATETLQDTFVNVYRKLNQFDHRSKFSTWLYSIVTNNCLMKNRRTKLEESSVSLDILQSPHDDYEAHKHREHPIHEWKSTPLDKVMNRELKDLLDVAIQKLPVDYRVVFILRDVEGQSAEETAKILKLSVPAVKSRLRRARIFLRNQLNEYMSS
ncbi:MAG: sigma-70 family RNA polymerase sigma factor [Ignavibacteriales bacterium]|nr:sigma-70 family RNA polymerase sigma factor [Ignavibacteriales bacterium]